MDSAKKVLDKVLYWITVVLFAALVVIVVWQVFSRQVVRDPATWTNEGARLTFVWLGLFAAAFVFGERGHIAVEILARKLPERFQQFLSVLVQALVLFFAVVVLVWGGWRATQNAWTQQLSSLPFTVGQMYLALPVAGVLIAFYAVYYMQAVLRDTQPAYAVIDQDAGGAADAPVQSDRLGDESLLIDSAPSPQSPPSSESPSSPEPPPSAESPPGAPSPGDHPADPPREA